MKSRLREAMEIARERGNEAGTEALKRAVQHYIDLLSRAVGAAPLPDWALIAAALDVYSAGIKLSSPECAEIAEKIRRSASMTVITVPVKGWEESAPPSSGA